MLFLLLIFISIIYFNRPINSSNQNKETKTSPLRIQHMHNDQQSDNDPLSVPLPKEIEQRLIEKNHSLFKNMKNNKKSYI